MPPKTTTDTPLTPRQRDVLLLVIATVCARGYPPTWREIAARLRFGFTAVRHHLVALAAKGWLSHEGCERTALRVLGARWHVAGQGRLGLRCLGTPEGWRLAQLLSGEIRLAEAP